ncbi:MAG: hypothetical protein A4S09_05185 [Proteobacteria bacterium SG_bin7]|nr:MAG: hypothetical protein A4S09_05185 [Proteobacteria bacterium SG_bin7]
MKNFIITLVSTISLHANANFYASVGTCVSSDPNGMTYKILALAGDIDDQSTTKGGLIVGIKNSAVDGISAAAETVILKRGPNENIIVSFAKDSVTKRQAGFRDTIILNADGSPTTVESKVSDNLVQKLTCQAGK